MLLTTLITGLLLTLMLSSTQAAYGEAGRVFGPESPTIRRLSWVERAIFVLMLLCAAILALTGIGTFLFSSHPMTGWMLMLHATVAPPFVILVTLLAVIWADRCQFVQDADRGFGLGAKLLFWLMVPLAVAVILSAVMPMTPMFGTHGQEVLYVTHQYSSIALAVVLALQAAAVFRRR